MNLDDLRDLDRNDVLAWLGLQRKQSTAASIIGSLSLFAGGLAVGAVAALLLAPKPGTDLREDLKTRLRRAKEGEDPSRPVVTREENNTSRAY
jgi:gas vesicle protein